MSYYTCSSSCFLYFCRIDNIIFDTETLEVRAVLDWEMSTLGNPIQDMCGNLMQYILPSSLPVMGGFLGEDLSGTGIPSLHDYIDQYCRLMAIPQIADPPIDYYMAYLCFRMAAIAQGVYKRFTMGEFCIGVD